MMTQAWHAESHLHQLKQERQAAVTAGRLRRQARLARRTAGCR